MAKSNLEKIEKNKNAQLAREIEVALPVELSGEQNRVLVREYCQKHFVSVGMCADICIHDKEDGNPHAHILLTMRPFEQDGLWGAKSKKEYMLDRNGKRIRLKNGIFKTRKVDTVDWNDQSKAEDWRAGWADAVNDFLAWQNRTERIDHRSYERQGIEQIPTVHMGVSAFQMEHRGIATERGNRNRKIQSENQMLRQLGARIRKLKSWLKAEIKNTVVQDENSSLFSPPINLITILTNTLNRRETKSFSRKVSDLKEIAKAVAFLQTYCITTMPKLKQQVSEMRSQFDAVSSKIKSGEKRLKTLTEHIRQAETYLKHKAVYQKYKQQKSGKQDAFYQNYSSEIILYESAECYLKQNMNGNTTLPIKAWKAETEKLTAKKDELYQEFYRLKEEVREVEIIRRNVERAVHNEQNREISKNMETEL